MILGQKLTSPGKVIKQLLIYVASSYEIGGHEKQALTSNKLKSIFPVPFLEINIDTGEKNT